MKIILLFTLLLSSPVFSKNSAGCSDQVVYKCQVEKRRPGVCFPSVMTFTVAGDETYKLDLRFFWQRPCGWPPGGWRYAGRVADASDTLTSGTLMSIDSRTQKESVIGRYEIVEAGEKGDKKYRVILDTVTTKKEMPCQRLCKLSN